MEKLKFLAIKSDLKFMILIKVSDEMADLSDCYHPLYRYSILLMIYHGRKVTLKGIRNIENHIPGSSSCAMIFKLKNNTLKIKYLKILQPHRTETNKL